MKINKIPKCMSLNKYRNAHYFTINQEKKEHEVLVRMAIQESGQKIRPLETPIKTIFTFYSYKGRDIDGETISIKGFHDSLTQLGMIPDDNQKYLVAYEVKGTKEKGNFYDVEIIENFNSEFSRRNYKRIMREYELFLDTTYWDTYCVRDVDDRNFLTKMNWHFATKDEVEQFLALLKKYF